MLSYICGLLCCGIVVVLTYNLFTINWQPSNSYIVIVWSGQVPCHCLCESVHHQSDTGFDGAHWHVHTGNAEPCSIVCCWVCWFFFCCRWLAVSDFGLQSVLCTIHASRQLCARAPKDAQFEHLWPLELKFNPFIEALELEFTPLKSPRTEIHPLHWSTRAEIHPFQFCSVHGVGLLNLLVRSS